MNTQDRKRLREIYIRERTRINLQLCVVCKANNTIEEKKTKLQIYKYDHRTTILNTQIQK